MQTSHRHCYETARDFSPPMAPPSASKLAMEHKHS